MGFSSRNSVVSLSFVCSMHALILLLFFNLAVSAINISGNETDQKALLEFMVRITDDPLGIMNSWNISTHFCQWYGVLCGRRHRRVTVLDLHSLRLSGSMSPYIGNLSFLRELYLHNNSFIGEVPRQIGHLHRLELLLLNNNSITGEIPANLSSCSNLVQISLEYNRLAGSVPKELGSLLKLEILNLGRNNLAGSLPTSLGNLSSLQKFFVTENDLVGSIPDSIGKMMNLALLSLHGNMFSGNIPPSLFNLSSLQGLDVGNNYLEGKLPPDLGNCFPKIYFLSMTRNSFIGSVPPSICNATNLDVLQLSNNYLTGKVPSLEKLQKLRLLHIFFNHLGNGEADDLDFLSSLINTTNLSALAIDNNHFGGVLPKHISNFSMELTKMTIGNNQISGSIPPGIENLVNLRYFAVWNNSLSSIVPSNIGKLQNLEILYLDTNYFSGPIPSSLGNLTRLNELFLGRNKFHGSIPASLGDCQQLQKLDLSEANLTGSIPPQVLLISSLSDILELSYNRLNGSLPVEVGSLKNLDILAVAGNMLSGEIPSSLGRCTGLGRLYMDDNFFQGSIPSQLSSLRGLQILNLSNNNLSGEIPKFLETFPFLEHLNLAFNNFEGPLPVEGVFGNVSALSIMGNDKLCGGILEFQLPRCNLEKPEKRPGTKLKIIASALSALAGLILVLACLFLRRTRKKKRETTPTIVGISLLRLSYQSLLKATDGFSSSNLIGIGSFGSVYKGVLDQQGLIIAVKVLNLTRRGASKSFLAECEALRNIKHRNLVKILTACSGVDYQGNDFKALVYEFMANGSLEDWLHQPNENDPRRNLNFLQRLNVAIDVACALEYLHHQCESPVVHCDLKPSNVLLDSEMVGHVSDFGLVKFLPETSQDSIATVSSSIGVRGTIGYAPPEYGIGSEPSTYGDIYSYGILLLEMFTGKRPTDDVFNDGVNLRTMVNNALPEKVTEIADPVLLHEEEVGEASTATAQRRGRRRFNTRAILECLVSIFQIGVACSAELPRERTSINDVSAQLRSIRDELVGRGRHRQR